MRRLVVIGLAAASACTNSSTTGSASETPQDIRSACAPTMTRANARADIRVQGGCDPEADHYHCEVKVYSSSITVRLLGPEYSGSCGLVDKACFIPPLDEGSYALEFEEGEELNRTLDVAPEHPVFSCGRDGG